MTFNITRTELVWPGKYDENGDRVEPERVSLPFQVIERVNEARATREAKKASEMTLFDVWEGDKGDTFEDGWRNKLIWGDNKLVMSSLLEQFAGKIDLIYIDPPFATGMDFSYTVEIGDSGNSATRQQSAVEEKAYRDTWGQGVSSYIQMMAERLELARELLSERGSIFVHCDWRVNFLLRSVMEEIFGSQHFRNEIAWCYSSPGRNTTRFKPCHDTILYFSRGSNPIWTNPQQPLAEATLKVKSIKFKGQDKEWVRDRDTKDMVDWWDLNFPTGSGERLGYPTQKPESLLTRIIEASTTGESIVADFFCGSGTTLAVAEKLGRRWIGADLGRFAINTVRTRLLSIESCRPFDVLNLGKYERKYWQVATFGEDLDGDGVISLYEYLAFVLRLYGATPITGCQYLNGRKDNALVHIGAVDAPVTLDEIARSVEECVAMKGKELHILGWEWEMGLHDPMTEQASKKGVNLVLRQIPREIMEAQAAAKGDVQFFELAYLTTKVKPGKKNSFTVELTDFMIPNPDLVSDEIREKITKWSDYVDYWAVDWDFSDDTFHQQWVTYRTRQDRSLDLISDPHTYDQPGEHRVMVKVIDVFGNDTSTIITIEAH
jgi:adenine-specific DNA-methyltransferase